MEGYKNLAAAVVKAAVDDLDAAYRKIIKWEEEGKQRKIKLTQDQQTAVNFFKDGSEMREFYFSMLGIDGLPHEIISQCDYVEKACKI
ncbi:MAG TPA: hypothetical protein VFC74_06665 [Oscillospiraceae bacterium]|nr:hypothetical protein [Oscillospiraceae bacterium]